MDGITIVWSGLVATTLAICFCWAARALGLTSFNPTVLAGCLVIGDPRRPITDTVGLVLLLVLGSTLGPLLIGGGVRAWSGPAWVGGAVVGGGVGLVVAGTLPLYGMVSACIRSGVIPSPGPFGIAWGKPTPGIIFGGHMLYGAVAAAILAGFQ